jgi:hypothetical protein
MSVRGGGALRSCRATVSHAVTGARLIVAFRAHARRTMEHGNARAESRVAWSAGRGRSSLGMKKATGTRVETWVTRYADYLGLGIVFVLAAIVGGGVSLAGEDIPQLHSVVREVLLGAFGAGLIFLSSLQLVGLTSSR